LKFEDVERMLGPYVGSTLVGIVGAEGGKRIETVWESEDGETYLLTFWDTDGRSGYTHGGMHRMLGTAREYAQRWVGYAMRDCPVVAAATEPE
jgi:hypothetical protein